jgi:hypothetical protein
MVGNFLSSRVGKAAGVGVAYRAVSMNEGLGKPCARLSGWVWSQAQSEKIINLQNLQNFYPRRKRTGYYEILPLRVQILLRRRTRVASHGVFCEE